jgi:hypothetical protein
MVLQCINGVGSNPVEGRTKICVDGTYILDIIIWQQSNSAIFNILYRIMKNAFIQSQEIKYIIQTNCAAVYQWCGFKSRRGKNKNLTALKSNSNTVWFIYIHCISRCTNFDIWRLNVNLVVDIGLFMFASLEKPNR